MAVSPAKTILEEVADFTMSAPTPQQIIAYQIPDALQKRALDLLQRHRDNQLSPEERIEMEEFMKMEHFLTILKAKARLRLAGEA
jgi:hypothetical protein